METTPQSSFARRVAALVLLALAAAGPLPAGTPHAQPPYFDLQFAPIAGQPNQLSFSFGPIYAGRTYTPEFCTDLTAGNWQPLTTIAQDMKQLGCSCFNALLARMEEPGRTSQEIVVRAKIVVRGSVRL